MTYKELQKKLNPELQKLLAESRLELQGMEFKMATKQFSKVRSVRTLKKTIAQILTVLNSTPNDTTNDSVN